ncbi:membrane protein [Geobacillus genomosp. 3]|uniref:Membrane protein n=1 Tax=Geobacillus genomosp. 3 TaxID=1921421 RepID=S5ZCS1_GEOG3|nr:hypothetical protein [Geobacillus genomosp. 3]AGT32000.1 membrane protein [Geobacillus genomosp. 3]
MKRMSYLAGGATLMAVLALPPVSRWLESSMIGVMLGQIPLLVAAGWLFGLALPRRFAELLSRWNENGLPGLLLAVSVLAFWLLPRSVDASLNEPLMRLAKWGMLPLLAGLPLSFSWKRLHPIARGVVHANVISMLVVMGWLYLAVPVRVCNSYLLDQQNALGRTMIALAIVLAAFWLLRLFVAGTPKETTAR